MKSYLLCLGMLCCQICHGQLITESQNTFFLNVYDISVRTIIFKNNYDIKGTPMFNKDWGKGTVKFFNGRLLKDVSLQFDAFSNELYFKVDSIVFAFVNPVKEFALVYEEKGKKLSALFRNGYPGNKPAAAGIFYEVLQEGARFQLLKHTSKIIKDSYEYSAPLGKIYWPVYELYIFDTETRILKSLSSKGSLAELMPAYAETIAQLTGSKRYKFRSEKELADILGKLEHSLPGKPIEKKTQ